MHININQSSDLLRLLWKYLLSSIKSCFMSTGDDNSERPAIKLVAMLNNQQICHNTKLGEDRS